MAKELKKREEALKEYTWATEDLYASDALWEKDFENAKLRTQELAAFSGHLGESADMLLQFFEKSDEMDILTDRLASYANRKRDEDTTNAVYQAMYAKLMNWYTEYAAAMAFTVPEMVAIPEEIYEKEQPKLCVYRREISLMLARKEHTLSAAEERILAAAGNLTRISSETFSMFNNADLQFPVVPDGEGGQVRLTHGNYSHLLESADRSVRKAAFEAMYSVYDQFKNTAASMLSGHIKGLMFHAKQRNFATTMDAALFNTEVPVSVYKNLIQTVHDNMDLMYRYMEIRRKMLRLDKIHMYDLATPMVQGVDKKITFEKAKEMVLEGLAPMGEEYLSHLREGFDNRWIDVYENVGKRSGAYSSGAKVHPYVLLNYADNLDSVFTLAHEMGHALHSWYSNHTQPTVYSNYKIFVAEVASTCNEALLMQHLLNTTTDKLERMYLIDRAMNDFRTTLYRQTMFAEFEMRANEMAECGQALTAASLSKLHYELNELYYGKDVELDQQIAVEWARIPHFYYNFYVYQYATGYSAAMALSARILSEGESAVKDYIRFLSGGSSADPISLLKLAGVDMSTPEPIEKALQVFRGYIEELEAILP